MIGAERLKFAEGSLKQRRGYEQMARGSIAAGVQLDAGELKRSEADLAMCKQMQTEGDRCNA